MKPGSFVQPSRLLVWLALSVLGGVPLAAESVTLPWGEPAAGLGVFRDGDYLRGPAFFAVGDDHEILVADAYKGRLVWYAADGHFQAELPLPEVTPRMAAMSLVSDRSVVIANDQNLSRWSSAGIQEGRFSYGLVLPEGFWFTSTSATFLVLAGASDSSQQLDRSLTSATRFSLPLKNREAAAVRDEKGGIGLFHWDDQALVFGWKAPVAPRAVLAGGAFATGTVWVLHEPGIRHLWWVDGQGQLLGQRTDPVEAGQASLFAVTPELKPVIGAWTSQGLVLRWLDWEGDR